MSSIKSGHSDSSPVTERQSCGNRQTVDEGFFE